MRKIIPFFMLQLFAEGESGSEGGSAASAAGTPNGRNSRPEENTLFGIQPQESTQVAAAENGASSPQPNTAKEEKKSPSFEELLKNDPEFKKEYDTRVRKAINDRFRSNKQEKQRTDKSEQILAMLAPRFGIKTDGNMDLDAFAKAVENDTEYYSARAMKNGTSVDIERRMDGYEALKKAEQQRQEEAQRQAQEDRERAQFQAIVAQGEKLKEIYPAFDLGKEMENQAFVQLLHSNVPVKTAYEVIHKDEIMQAGMRYAVEQTAQKVAASVQANAARPSEGVLGSRTAVNHVTDPTKLTDAQREEIRIRVRRGEKIVW